MLSSKTTQDKLLESQSVQTLIPLDSSIVAVTGLGGRPYGSWQCVSDGSMWLQDALPGPRAIPEARVMIYGYASKTRSDSHANLDDFTDGFLRALETSRLLPHENVCKQWLCCPPISIFCRTSCSVSPIADTHIRRCSVGLSYSWATVLEA